MTLKELSELLYTINLSINDYYRDNGINNNAIALHSPIVNKVSNGSIIVDIAIAVFSNVTSILLTEYITHRMTKLRKTKNDNDVNNVCIKAGDNNTINIHIEHK